MSPSEVRRPILAAEGVSKSFGVTQVLHRADLTLYPGEVLALMGENGAGKSTLMKILAGVHPPTEGTLRFEGREVTLSGPRQAQDLGVCMIHQELNLVEQLSVAENVFLGREFLLPGGLIDRQRMRSETRRLLEMLDLDVDPDTAVGALRVGQQQLVEIAKALSVDARVLIMDEPTSALSDHEVGRLFERINVLTARGVAIVYITHKMDEVFRIADRITVMRDGRVITTQPAADLDEDRLVTLMVGRDIQDFFVKAEAVQGTTVLQVEDLCLAHPHRPGDFLVDHVSFACRRGEVLGVFGLMGAGRTEMLETLFGRHPKRSSGRVRVEGREVAIRCPRDAIAAGLALVPEDRKAQGLVLSMAVRDNVSLACLPRIESHGLLSTRLENRLVQRYVDRLHIKITHHRQLAAHLSGGNQQKVVIAKWLATDPKVLLLDDPTRGIDINAKNEIYKLISDLAAAGMAIVMVSSELPEIMRIADRIVVLSEGRLTGEFSHAEATEQALLRAALPGASPQRNPDHATSTEEQEPSHD